MKESLIACVFNGRLPKLLQDLTLSLGILQWAGGEQEIRKKQIKVTRKVLLFCPFSFFHCVFLCLSFSPLFSIFYCLSFPFFSIFHCLSFPFFSLSLSISLFLPLSSLLTLSALPLSLTLFSPFACFLFCFLSSPKSMFLFPFCPLFPLVSSSPPFPLLVSFTLCLL